MMECFARFVIRQGYGAMAPNNIGSQSAPMYESWQDAGKRLFGNQFVDVLMAEISKHRQTRKEGKAAYVRRQPQTREHHCHWPGCEKQVPPAVWGCLQHWKRLPQEIRDKIWATYRKGQEIDQRPSPAYVEAAQEARAWAMEWNRQNDTTAQAPQQAGLF